MQQPTPQQLQQMQQMMMMQQRQQQAAAAAAAGGGGGGGGPVPPQQMPGGKGMQAAPVVNFNKRNFQVIYPQYLDSTLTPAEGRRISKAQAIENPHPQEIIAALHELGFRKILVDQRASFPSAQSQPRCVPAPRTCIRVEIKSPQDEHYIKKSEFDTQTRQATVAAAPNKHQVLVKVCELIKKQGHPRPPRFKTGIEVATEVAAQVNPQTGAPPQKALAGGKK